jgi:AbiJ N-terminal domain 3
MRKVSAVSLARPPGDTDDREETPAIERFPARRVGRSAPPHGGGQGRRGVIISPVQFGAPQTITPATRRDITDYISAERINWSGRLEEAASVGRVWDLERIRSTDRRFSDAAGDIHQHR